MEELKSRYEWLAPTINERGYVIGAEVGCRAGATAGYILRNCPDLQVLYAVDLWGQTLIPKQKAYWQSIYGHMPPARYRNWRVKFDKNIEPFKDQVRILQGVSWEMAGNVLDNSLDFVFIDADHTYESVRKDIKAWTPKLKDGGMLSGHDDHLEGVLKVLRECIPNWIATGVDYVWYCNKEDVLCP